MLGVETEGEDEPCIEGFSVGSREGEWCYLIFWELLERVKGKGERWCTGETPFLGLVKVLEVDGADFMGIQGTTRVRIDISRSARWAKQTVFGRKEW